MPKRRAGECSQANSKAKEPKPSTSKACANVKITNVRVSANVKIAKKKPKKVSKGMTVISKRSGMRIKTPKFMPHMPEPEMSFDDFKGLTAEAIQKELDKQKAAMETLVHKFSKVDCNGGDLASHQRKYYDYLYRAQLELRNQVVSLVDDYINVDPSSDKDVKPITAVDVIHTPWCALCGKIGRTPLRKCINCCIAFHKSCYETELLTYAQPEDDNDDPCVAELKKNCIKCLWEKSLGTGDIVWHKMKSFPWWPAKIVPHNMQPKGLKNPPGPKHVLLLYCGSKNYAWAHIKQLCTFDINYDALKKNAKKDFQFAIDEALHELLPKTISLCNLENDINH